MDNKTSWYSGHLSAQEKWKNPSPTKGVAYFPLVGKQTSGIAAVSCELSLDNRGTKSFALNGHQGVLIEEILGDSRYSEPSGQSTKSVDVRFFPSDFVDRSFGLALAIADKLSRIEITIPHFPKILATGEIRKDGLGDIQAIKELDKKIKIAKGELSTGDYFVFPQSNQTDLNDHNLKTKIIELEDLGVTVLAVAHIDEFLEFFLSRHQRKQTRAQAINKHLKWKMKSAVALLLFIGTGIYAAYSFLPIKGISGHGLSSVFFLSGESTSAACETLIKAIPIPRTAYQSNSLKDRSECRRLLEASDFRLNAVKIAANALINMPNNADLQDHVLAKYYKLNTEDLERPKFEPFKEKIKLAADLSKEASTSPRRFSSILKAYEQYKGIFPATIASSEEFSQIRKKLKPYDLERVPLEIAAILADAEKVKNELRKSDLKLIILQHKLDLYERSKGANKNDLTSFIFSLNGLEKEKTIKAGIDIEKLPY